MQWKSFKNRNKKNSEKSCRKYVIFFSTHNEILKMMIYILLNIWFCKWIWKMISFFQGFFFFFYMSILFNKHFFFKVKKWKFWSWMVFGLIGFWDFWHFVPFFFWFASGFWGLASFRFLNSIWFQLKFGLFFWVFVLFHYCNLVFACSGRGAGPKYGARESSGQRRTGELRSWLNNAGPHPGGSGADCATPHLTGNPQRRASAARRYVRRCVRNISEKNVRKNVRRYVGRNVRKYVKRRMSEEISKICQKKCEKIRQKI